MSNSYSYSIFTSTKKLPENWNDLAISNIFLSKEYLQIIEKSAPENMICHFIGIFHDTELIGIALCQFLDLNKLQSFGERDKCIKTMVRNF
ncbi:MAG: 8-amino-7-oxononanoate synthase, partial [Bacteroidia bacterium]|nr:8-amino-7-oxononanoate synthase [Bacteroidia bacterium]